MSASANVSRKGSINLLNEDLAREYQAIPYTFLSLENEKETDRNDRARIRQADELGIDTPKIE